MLLGRFGASATSTCSITSLSTPVNGPLHGSGPPFRICLSASAACTQPGRAMSCPLHASTPRNDTMAMRLPPQRELTICWPQHACSDLAAILQRPEALFAEISSQNLLTAPRPLWENARPRCRTGLRLLHAAPSAPSADSAPSCRDKIVLGKRERLLARTYSR